MNDNFEQELPNADHHDVSKEMPMVIDEKELEKAEKLEKEKQKILDDAVSGRMDDMRGRVAYLLNNSVEARNSDIELTWLYWDTFEKELFKRGGLINKEVYRKLTQPNSLIRLRAKIQNEYKLFQANDKVKKFRGVLEQEKKQEAIDDKPTSSPIYSVYIDETGKTQQYLSVGSLWLYNIAESVFSFFKLKEWRKQRGIDYEFHFVKVKDHNIDSYKAFFLEFLVLNPSTGFKVIIIDKAGISNIGNAITDLTFHLLNKGIRHEHKSKRAPLPRLLQVILDAEEKGSDQIKIENLKERIVGQKIDGLAIDSFTALESEDNIYLQVVDLFISSVNRKLHPQEGVKNAKDALADYILDLLKFDISSVDKNSDVDKSMVVDLTYKKNSKSPLP